MGTKGCKNTKTTVSFLIKRAFWLANGLFFFGKDCGIFLDTAGYAGGLAGAHSMLL